jgi:hypothetical protein
MKVMLVIPKHYYRVLLGHCAMLWPEYRALKSGILVDHETGPQIQILCDAQRLQLIMNFAGRVCSEAIPHIRQISDWSI